MNYFISGPNLQGRYLHPHPADSAGRQSNHAHTWNFWGIVGSGGKFGLAAAADARARNATAAKADRATAHVNGRPKHNLWRERSEGIFLSHY